MILSVTKASGILGVSKNHLYVLRRRGKITFNLDGRGIEESELARVFPKEMSNYFSSITSSSVSKNTDDYNHEIPPITDNDQLLHQKIDHLTDKISMMEENEKFLKKQLDMEQDRTQKLIESVQHQTKFLLPKEDKQSTPFWRWKK